ncbi:uncharacterized protein LOC107608148 [Arachis ipaensis]|uniref:uncharacterized protein LOC107608148 n=1 Tax=Arachis ipaensis TaxID=130454 RepID=UPI000A2B0ED7|nr:uncharacterized protein LOC107608148 [Arachis ipaensis]
MELGEKREESCDVNEEEKGKRGLTTPPAQERTEGREKVTRLRKRESEGAVAPLRGRGRTTAVAASPSPIDGGENARRAVTPWENAHGKREKTPSRIPSPPDPCHRHEPPLFWLPEAAAEPLPSWIEFRRFYIKVKVTVGPSEFLAAVGDASGSARDCGCSILLLLIELLGLPVIIKAVSAIAEVSRPAIEAAVGFRRRGMVLVTPLVYGFNFRALPFQELEEAL